MLILKLFVGFWDSLERVIFCYILQLQIFFRLVGFWDSLKRVIFCYISYNYKYFLDDRTEGVNLDPLVDPSLRLVLSYRKL